VKWEKASTQFWSQSLGGHAAVPNITTKIDVSHTSTSPQHPQPCQLWSAQGMPINLPPINIRDMTPNRPPQPYISTKNYQC